MAQGTTKGVPIDTDGTLANNSDLLVPSQKAIKTYITNTSVALTGVQTVAGAKTFSSLTSFSAGVNITPPTGSGSTSAGIIVSGSNTNGGTSYVDFLKATNTAVGATNINKWFRLNSTGGLEIINSNYSTNIFTLTDAGVLTTASTVNGASPTEMGYLSGVTSGIQTQLNAKLASSAYDWIPATAYQTLGSSIKGFNLGVPGVDRLTGAVAFTTGQIRFISYYLPQAATITGVKWYQTTQGVYTAASYNGVGLYSYSGGTLTLVASSTNDGTIWQTASNTWGTKAFSSPYSASAGIYYVACIWVSSSITTAPSIGVASSMSQSSVATFDFLNSAKLSATLSTQTSLPSSQTIGSPVVSSATLPALFLY
jgi:hypothetical protein